MQHPFEGSHQAVEDLVSLWQFGGGTWVPAGQADMAQEVAEAKTWV